MGWRQESLLTEDETNIVCTLLLQNEYIYEYACPLNRQSIFFRSFTMSTWQGYKFGLYLDRKVGIVISINSVAFIFLHNQIYMKEICFRYIPKRYNVWTVFWIVNNRGKNDVNLTYKEHIWWSKGALDDILYSLMNSQASIYFENKFKFKCSIYSIFI